MSAQMGTGWALACAGLAAGAAVLATPRARTVRAPSRAVPASGGGVRRLTGDDPLRAVTAADVAALAQLLAAVLRSGLPAVRAWAVLAERAGPVQRLCSVVARLLAAGGTAPEGVRLAVASPMVTPARRPTPRALLALRPNLRALRPVRGEVVTAPVRGRAGRRRRAEVAAALRRLAVCLEVAERTGAPLAEVLDGFAAGLLADAAARAEVEVALEAPRATASLLSFLPLAGLALGALLGADPAGTLLATPPGRVCLVAGLALWGVARWWVRRLVAAAVSPG